MGFWAGSLGFWAGVWDRILEFWAGSLGWECGIWGWDFGILGWHMIHLPPTSQSHPSSWCRSLCDPKIGVRFSSTAPNPCSSHPLHLHSLPGSFRLSTTGRNTSLSLFSSSGVRSTVSWYSFREMMSWLSGKGTKNTSWGLEFCGIHPWRGGDPSMASRDL